MTDPRLSGAARHADDTRRRFLVDVVALVPLARLIEVHLFTPIRQGGTETGLAVVVAQRTVADIAPAPVPNDDAVSDAGMACDPTDDAAGPIAPEPGPPIETLDELLEDTTEGPPRHTIFAARYRLVLRGPDRGRWSVDVVEEADAPLITVEAVVRGVQRRAGDAAAADRLDAETVARTIDGVI